MELSATFSHLLFLLTLYNAEGRHRRPLCKTRSAPHADHGLDETEIMRVRINPRNHQEHTSGDAKNQAHHTENNGGLSADCLFHDANLLLIGCLGLFFR